MSIRKVVTRGFGNGTFAGTIADVVRRGYTAAAVAAGALTALLQHNPGSGWVDVAGTTRNVTGSPGDWPNLSFDTVLDVGAGDQLRVVWVNNETNTFTIPADNSSFIVEYLRLQQ